MNKKSCKGNFGRVFHPTNIKKELHYLLHHACDAESELKRDDQKKEALFEATYFLLRQKNASEQLHIDFFTYVARVGKGAPSILDYPLYLNQKVNSVGSLFSSDENVRILAEIDLF